MSEHKDVCAAILGVMSEVGYVTKTGQMSGSNPYTYAGEADLIHALRPALINNKLIIFPRNTEVLANEEYETRSGSVMHRTQLRITYVLRHVVSGTEIEIQVIGEGADNGDKSTYKAMTGAFKYALRQPFVIETGDDPDTGNSTEQEKETEAPSKKQPEKKPSTSSNKEKALASEQEEENVGFDADVMNRAMGYKVPKDFPKAGTAFSKLIMDEDMGPILLGFFAKKSPDGGGAFFDPKTDDEKKVHNAALYIFDNNPTFKENWQKYTESVE